ncbi:hypothetical protein BD31_I0589 [Candidatus Nitrosopumilus salaria BD31]|uniref:Uncharacterized protein n=1 Tax=Candidatus Nitrosopumilus salarius BD31 TaxID=859350 RepID=I3D309_9ARCH|nr:hypothetical protein [Candidatus Nitrosopumilus salaria]EIJ66102.1 hypothetical protein BD31_I0589 [Candidatus Nitrosopumilus salaria BD31]
MLSISKFGLEILEEIFVCPQCLTGEYVCAIHTKNIKLLLIRDVKNEINKLIKQQYSFN